MTEPASMSDEEVVRAAWVDAGSAPPWGDCERWQVYFGHDYVHGTTEAQAWSAARKYTEERQEEIRLVEEEIEMLENEDRHDDYPPYLRILAREEAALAELKKGLR